MRDITAEEREREHREAVNAITLEVADKVTVQLMYTDPEIRTRKQIVKTSEKNGLYLALDIADAWLTRALAE